LDATWELLNESICHDETAFISKIPNSQLPSKAKTHLKNQTQTSLSKSLKVAKNRKKAAHKVEAFSPKEFADKSAIGDRLTGKSRETKLWIARIDVT
jgi:hypothetical protein